MPVVLWAYYTQLSMGGCMHIYNASSFFNNLLFIVMFFFFFFFFFNRLQAGVALLPNSYVSRMMIETATMNSDDRAAWLEKDDEIDAAQEVATSEGQVLVS